MRGANKKGVLPLTHGTGFTIAFKLSANIMIHHHASQLFLTPHRIRHRLQVSEVGISDLSY